MKGSLSPLNLHPYNHIVVSLIVCPAGSLLRPLARRQQNVAESCGK